MDETADTACFNDDVGAIVFYDALRGDGDFFDDGLIKCVVFPSFF